MNKLRITCDGTRMVSLNELIPFQGELKSLPKANYRKIVGSLEKHGFSFPFFVWPSKGKLYVSDGHQRLRVLQQLAKEGVTLPEKFPAVNIEAATIKEAKEKILLLSSQYGEMSYDSVYEFMNDAGLTLDDISFVDLPSIKLQTLDNGWFSDSVGPSVKVNLTKQDAINKKWKVKRGDVWELPSAHGEPHQFICLDSIREREHIDKIKFAADLICTDPDFNTEPDGILQACSMADAAMILTCSHQAFALGNRWNLRLDLVWKRRIAAKTPPVYMPSIYHGLILYLTKPKTKPRPWIRPTPDFGSVIELESEDFYDRALVPHAKSIELFSIMLSGFPWAKKIVDPFACAGTTMIACELSKRRSLNFELYPETVAVALERWHSTFPELKPARVDSFKPSVEVRSARRKHGGPAAVRSGVKAFNKAMRSADEFRTS